MATVNVNPISNEATFIPDAFTKTHEITGILAFAKRLQTLILMEPGTIPNAVDIGVGIGMYIGEFADDETLNEVIVKIKNQAARYIPNAPSHDISIVYVKDKTTNSTGLAITVTI